MSRRMRRQFEDSNISFLDVICCGFGAIVLLLVIVKPTQPVVLEESPIDLNGQVRLLQERLFEIRGQVDYLETELDAKQEQLGKTTDRVAILRTQLDTLQGQQALSEKDGIDGQASVEELQIALQSLTREMRKLLRSRRAANDYIGGIPVDSEYVIFIIDTSGSMQTAWGRLVSEVRNILNIYPNMKGVQVMSDEGQYMFPEYRGEWITDSRARRGAILSKLRTWAPFSNSSPVRGIDTAIRTFYDPAKKISLFVIGDDVAGASIPVVLEVVSELNKKRRDGDTLVRIHTVGVPTPRNFGRQLGLNSGGMRYANMMRLMAEQNNGSFVGLNDWR
ncbi:MAG: VWA domain-containing protein [Pseudomonadota bacterium]